MYFRQYMSSEADSDIYLDCCAVPVFRSLDSYSGFSVIGKGVPIQLSAFTTFTSAPMRTMELDQPSKGPGYAAIN